MPRCVFAIDTTQYAGNFERAMCAFVTGYIDPHLAQLGSWWRSIIAALPQADLAALAWAEELAHVVPYDHYNTMRSAARYVPWSTASRRIAGGSVPLVSVERLIHG